MMRLGEALGAKQQTFMGLSGMGDLVLTCTDDQSRNRRMGLGLAQSKSADEIAAEIGQVVEGVYAAKAIRDVAARERCEMPICEQVYRILYEGVAPDEAGKSPHGPLIEKRKSVGREITSASRSNLNPRVCTLRKKETPEVGPERRRIGR